MRSRIYQPYQRLIVLILAILGLGAISAPLFLRDAAGASRIAGQQTSSEGVWEEIDRRGIRLGALGATLPATYRALRLNPDALRSVLSRAPREVVERSIQSDTILSLPLPGTRYGRFQIEESQVLAPELAAQFPELKSYRGRGIDDPTAWLRFDLTPRGFHAFVTSGEETFAIHPANLEDNTRYVVYRSEDDLTKAEDFLCQVMEPEGRSRRTLSTRVVGGASATSAQITGPTLRTYRIAIATTQEYTNSFGGGTVGGTLSTISTWLNGLNLFYERELSIRFVLVANNSNVIYSTEPDPFTNGDTGAMIDEARATINSQIGVANYDVGHVLGLGGAGFISGRAYLGVVCFTTYKGGGATVIGEGIPVGNINALSVLIHEMGHEFGASHSFNAYCNGNRDPNAAYESGSGLTIMAYAGSCQPDAIVNGNALHFHSGSINEIYSYITSGGGSCAVQTSTGNAAPVINAASDYTIPRGTPFILSATASDPDDQANLTYSWEQIDSGGASYLNPPYTDAGDPSTTTRPIFRPFSPSSSLSRTFPKLTYILNNGNVPPATIGGLQTAENLPTVGRQLNFNLAVRDGRGGTSLDGVSLSVADNAGPFLVTQPNTGETWGAGTVQTITWTVNGTNVAPVNCTQVRLSLSLDGGQSFPAVLAASTPNDGSQAVTMPAGQATATARIKVEAVGNIFFDVSNVNFSIVPPNSCQGVTSLQQLMGYPGTDVNLTGVNLSGVSSVRFGGNVAASFSVLSSTQLRATVPAGAVTGPIRLIKPSCADAYSSTFTINPSPPVVLAVDDGSYESAYIGGGYAVNRLTPSSYPATLNSVSIFFAEWTGIQVGTNIDILVGSNPDGDGNINNTVFQQMATTVQALDQFNVYLVPSLTINTGDFVVGFRYTPTNGVYPVVFDRSPPALGRSYGSSDGVSFTLQDNYGAGFVGNAGIRASIFHGQPASNCNPAILPASENFSSNGGTGMIGVTIEPGCNWTATSNNPSFITITGGAAGSGNGSASFSVAQNSGVARSGTITVAGQTFTVRQGANFADVAQDHIFFTFIGKLSAAGITVGCGQNPQGQPLYCPNGIVSREQMAAFIIRALGEFNPPTPASQRFADVPPSHIFYAFIDRMAVRGITLGCGQDAQGNPIYCPGNVVSREQMAAFMIRALGDFNPPFPSMQRFTDVPSSNIFYAFIEQMAVRGITLGCNAQGPLYCPIDGVSRAQMAAFLVRAFGL